MRSEPQKVADFTFYDVTVMSSNIFCYCNLTFAHLWNDIYKNYGKEAMKKYK